MQIHILEYFETGAAMTCQDKVAVIEEGAQYTFRQIERFAKNCAAVLRARLPEGRAIVPVFLPKSAGTIVADMGTLYAADAYANLDVKSPPQRLKGMLDNLAPAVIITNRTHAPALRAIEVPEETLLFVEDVMVDEVRYDNAALLRGLEGIIDTDPCCLIHTSGSTGIPKGVALQHRCTIDFVDWAFERLSLDGSEVMGSLAPTYFDPFTLEFCLLMAKGATWVVIPDQSAAFPVKLIQFLQQQPVNFIFWVPTIMVNIANQDLLATMSLDRIKKVFFIGEVFPTRHLNYWRRHLAGAVFVNLYGPIETTVASTYFIVDREMADDDKLPVGFPCRNTEILILNDENKLAQGQEQGEICVRGSSLALGYYNNPERTAKGFVQNPLQPHYPELIYRTGDVGYRNERGEIMYLGRRDFQIKHLGYRIELGEIEHAVLKVDGVRNCCVVYNQNKKEITLFYEGDNELSQAFLREQLQPLLPKYMLPTVVHHMPLMPRNPNGKIDRATLVATVN